MAVKRLPSTLVWDAEYIGRLFRRKKILDRADLARHIGVSYATVRHYFEDDWSGLVSPKIVAAICVTFNVSPGSLIKDPRS